MRTMFPLFVAFAIAGCETSSPLSNLGCDRGGPGVCPAGGQVAGANGGASGLGGVAEGDASAGYGGSPSTGGTIGSGSDTPGAGGAGSGGLGSTGGHQVSGGSATGGVPSSGGLASAGVDAAAGVSGSGGSNNLAGASGTGAFAAGGSVLQTGGRLGTGGTVGSGGVRTGGTVGSGGVGTGGAGGQTTGPDAGTGYTITEFPVCQGGCTLGDLVVGADDNLWFADVYNDRIRRMTLDGVITDFALLDLSSPYYMTLGPDKAIWFTEGYGNKVGRITTSGQITEFPLPNPKSYPGDILVGPDGNLWFAEKNRMARMSLNGELVEYPVAATPFQLTVGGDGNLWYTEGGVGGKIARFTLTGVVTEFDTPAPKPFTWGITTGPDGNVWFTFYGDGEGFGRLGKITPDGVITEYKTGVYGDDLIFDKNGALWFSATANTVCRRDATGAITQFTPPGAYSSPSGIVFGPDGNLWFLEGGAGMMGRLNINR